jgi:hypothetical protein
MNTTNSIDFFIQFTCRKCPLFTVLYEELSYNLRDEYERIILYISFYFKSKKKTNENNKQ